MWRIIIPLLLIAVVAAETENEVDLDLDHPIPLGKSESNNKREAYVTLLYGDGEYLLSVRVLGLSLKLTGTKREMIVLCTEEVSAESRKILERDGWIVKSVSSIYNPYLWQPKNSKRYGQVFTKFEIWKLTVYRRVVFLDSDTLVCDNIDELFQCGKFCAAYRHSDLFNSGVLVVKPDLQEHDNLFKKVADRRSYDWADQGFLNYYFQSLIYAPMFNASDSKHHEESMRLPALYNADVSQYYANPNTYFPLYKIKVMHYTVGEAKPWRWWAYILFNQNWQWVALRDQLQPTDVNFSGLIVPASLNLFLIFILRGLRYMEMPAQVLAVGAKCRGSLYKVIAAAIILFSHAFGFVAVPELMHPHYAIPAFCLWTVFCLQLCCSCFRLVTKQPGRAIQIRSVKYIVLIGLLIVIPMVVPLYMSVVNFQRRVYTFIGLHVLCFVSNYFITMKIVL